MADPDRMQGTVQLLAPERQKFHQGRKLRRKIIVLPDIGLEQQRMIRKPIENFRRRQAKAFELTHEIARSTLGRHSPTSLAERLGLHANYGPPSHFIVINAIARSKV